MANRWKGNFVVATAATSSGTAYTGKANGSWSLNNQIQQKQAGFWAIGIGAPVTPTIGTAVGGDSQASISFTSGATGGGTVTYTVTSTPGNITATGSASPITITGLTNGTAYTFTVRATNSFGYSSSESGSSNSVIPQATSLSLATDTSPYITSYKFSSGLTTKYAQPSTLPTGTGVDVDYDRNNEALVIGHVISPFITMYPWAASTGYGTKFSNPSTLPGSHCFGVNFSKTSNYVVACPNATPYAIVYPYSTSTGFGTIINNASGLPTGPAAIKFNTVGNVIFTASSASPYIAAIPFTSGSFGAKYANPSTLPTSYVQDISIFNNYIAVAGSAPTVSMYSFSNGWGAKYADPTTSITPACYSITFNKTGNTVGVAVSATPFIAAYAWSAAGWGSKYANPATLPAGTGNGVSFSEDGLNIAVGHAVSPFVTVYSWSAGFGTSYTNPSSLPTGTSNELKFSK